MRKTIIALSVSLLLTACSSGPDDRAEDFMTAAASGETEEAIEYLDPQIRSMMGSKIEGPVSSVGKDALEHDGLSSVEILETQTNGDRAKVKLQINFGNGKNKKTNVQMRKVDGEWYVSG